MGQRPEGISTPLSTAQAGMWLSHQLDPTGRAGTLAEYLEIHGPVDPVLLDAAWQEVWAETDACRARFTLDSAAPVQVIAPPVARGVPFVDLSADADPAVAAGKWRPCVASRREPVRAGPGCCSR
jgi:Condensation domain